MKAKGRWVRVERHKWNNGRTYPVRQIHTWHYRGQLFGDVIYLVWRPVRKGRKA